MKKQKSILAIALSIVLFSCSNNESVSSSPLDTTTATSTSYEVVSTAALPAAAATYLKTNYATASTEVNLLANGTYVAYVTQTVSSTGKLATAATAKSLKKLSFSSKGVLLSALNMTPIAIADLLPAIKTYISTNYAGATINTAHSETDGSFDVIITAADGTISKLNFAADGTFVSIKAAKSTGNHKHNHLNPSTPVAVADLLGAITTYISTTYPGATITAAHKESDGTFDVFVTTTAGAKLNLNFSATGDFVAVSSDDVHDSGNGSVVAIADLSTTITTYINTNYAGATINEARTDAAGGFVVNITSADGQKLVLKFKADGTFVGLCSHSNHHFAASESAVAVANLVANIKTYINTNYAGATIKEAHLESDGTYDVVIVTSANAQLKLNFSATGAFIAIKN